MDLKSIFLAFTKSWCKTKDGITYYIRLHVQKNGEGKWGITATYPRFGCSGSVVSNINSGGSTNYLVPFTPPLSMGNRYAYVIATGNTAEDAKINAKFAASQISFKLISINEKRVVEDLNALPQMEEK